MDLDPPRPLFGYPIRGLHRHVLAGTKRHHPAQVALLKPLVIQSPLALGPSNLSVSRDRGGHWRAVHIHKNKA